MRSLAFVIPVLFLTACGPSAQTEVAEETQTNVVEAADITADALPKEEALAAQDALVDGFRSGDVHGASFLAQMAAFANHPDPAVVIGSTRELSFIYDEFPDLRRGLARHVTRTYGRVYRAARASDTEVSKQISAGLGNIMAREGNDQEARNYLIRQGSLYLQLDPTREDLKPTVPLHLLESAFVETMRARPEVTFEPLLRLVQSGTDLEREAGLLALSTVSNKAQMREFYDWIIQDRDTLSSEQKLIAMGRIWLEPSGFEMMLETLKSFISQSDEVISEIHSENARLEANTFCSNDRKEKVSQFFSIIEDDDIQVGDILEIARDEIEDCLRFKEMQGPSLIAALTQ